MCVASDKCAINQARHYRLGMHVPIVLSAGRDLQRLRSGCRCAGAIQSAQSVGDRDFTGKWPFSVQARVFENLAARVHICESARPKGGDLPRAGNLPSIRAVSN